MSSNVEAAKMTRTFNEKIRCLKCGNEQTAETDFERWFRGQKELDSRDTGIVRFDLDMLLHKYKVCIDGKGDRDIQCMMFVEVKTFMAKPSMAQTDTLSMLGQVLRNRKQNIHSDPRKQVQYQTRKVFSKLLNKDVTIKLFGAHLLQLERTNPDNSSVILWDYKPVTKQILMELLRFERDPDRIDLMIDHRRRSRPFSKMPMLDFKDDFNNEEIL
jgi:hypothetical protein